MSLFLVRRSSKRRVLMFLIVESCSDLTALIIKFNLSGRLFFQYSENYANPRHCWEFLVARLE